MRRNIAITGATGLLGASLANTFIENGDEVYALIKDEQPTTILSKQVVRIYGDVQLRQDIEYFIHKSNPTHFFHLAAQTQAFESTNYPYQTFMSNVVGTLNVVEGLRHFSSCQSIIIASSDKAYGELSGKEYLEGHPLKGIFPYDASKSAADIVANSYRETYNMPIVVTRACNIYGIGDHNQNRLIPGVVFSHLNNSIFQIRNEGKHIREYIHVDDVVSAYLMIMEYTSKFNDVGAFNISSGEEFTTLEVFKMIENIVGTSVQHLLVTQNDYEINRQLMNSELLRNKTGWSPHVKMVEALPQIVAWYLTNY
jgi:CDP-glucose 4,6-dehydratase